MYMASLKIAASQASNTKIKHLMLKVKWIQGLIKKGKIKLTYVETKKNTSDIFTKALERPLFETHREKMMPTKSTN